jgi:hypothetical protein
MFMCMCLHRERVRVGEAIVPVDAMYVFEHATVCVCGESTQLD